MSARATVEVVEGGTSRVVGVPRSGLKVGRSPDEGLVLASRSVSAFHAELTWEGDDLFLRDTGSSYGTRRDGIALTGATRISDGDEVVLGGTAILRFSIFGARFGAPVEALGGEDDHLVPAPAPVDVQPFAIDMLPIAESLFQATDAEDLGRRIARAAVLHFNPSRAALLELEGAQDRYRVLGLGGGAVDASFVSRTIAREAARRGVAQYAEGQRERPLASVIRSGATSAIAAGIRPHDGRVRLLYMDALLDAPRLTWSHALTLELFAAHAAGAFDALEARRTLGEELRRFDQLRRYFSPAVAEYILKADAGALERPQHVHATVLFADLVGYTKLSERLRGDPEALLRVLNRWLDLGARIVLDHGGTLDKFIGDAVMAVFGAPLPSVDGELLAVRCALEMCREIREVARETGEPLEITVGINSGEVLAGSVGSRRRLEYTVLGDTVNVASRLQGQAHAGEILIGPLTAERVGRHVTIETAGMLSLKNHEDVAAYRVVTPRPA